MSCHLGPQCTMLLEFILFQSQLNEFLSERINFKHFRRPIRYHRFSIFYSDLPCPFWGSWLVTWPLAISNWNCIERLNWKCSWKSIFHLSLFTQNTQAKAKTKGTGQKGRGPKGGGGGEGQAKRAKWNCKRKSKTQQQHAAVAAATAAGKTARKTAGKTATSQSVTGWVGNNMSMWAGVL